MSVTMTTKDSFPVIDVTHKPRRMQGDNIRANIRSDESTVSVSSAEDSVPKVLTLERAISFYESHAEGNLKDFYLQTAKWLREVLDRKTPQAKTAPVEEPIFDAEEEPVPHDEHRGV